MNIKIALGIFLPLALTIILVILSTANIGFSVNKENVQSVQFDALFVDKDAPKNNILLQTITITNDFFLPKKYELPKLVVCLSDKEGVTEARNLQIKYNEGSYTSGTDVPIFDEIFFDYDYDYYSKQSVELPTNSKKQVRVLGEPVYLYNYETEVQSYKQYDELLLIQTKGTAYYYNCGNLESKDLNTAIHIPILGK